MKKITLQITKMHCASCSINIEKFLTKTKGIQSALVNFATEKAFIEYDESIMDEKHIIELIEGFGYGVIPRSKVESRKSKLAENTLKRKFITALILSIPLFYLAMGPMIGLPKISMSPLVNIIIQFVLSTSVIYTFLYIWQAGFVSLIKKRPNMDALVFIGTAAAYFYSLGSSIVYIMNQTSKLPHLYFESALFILVFISLGKYLEKVTKGKTSDAIKKLIALQPKEAIIERNGKEEKISISDIKVGDVVIVKPGAKIPIDGVVIDGYSGVDQKAITGESIPVEKKQGDQVIGATINKTGILKIKAEKVGFDTMLSQIIKIVEDAMGTKAPIQLLADKVALYFVPTVIGLSIIAFIVWLIAGHSFTFALTVFVAVLIIACPCALGLATPTAVMMGTGLAAKKGILIKTSDALEKAHKITTVVFDKTGTLTKGEPEVTDTITLSDKISAQEIIQIAASLEKNSDHPLAHAVVQKAQNKTMNLIQVTDFEDEPGKGVKGKLTFYNKESQVFLGNKKIMQDNNIEISSEANNIIETFQANGKTVMILALDIEIIGVIGLADTLKDYSKDAVARLHKMGKKVAMISGDNELAAQAIAKELSIDYVLADVLPQDKSNEIKKLQSKGEVVAMIGDGINDAPALAQSDLGIALGSGTDVAIETGELVLIKDDLRDVISAIDISKYTLRKIKQGLFWAFIYNIIGIPIAAGILYPFTGWLLSPVIASAAMAFSSVSVVFNALMMKGYK